MANSTQSTVCWHMDDLRVPNMNEAAVTVFLLNIVYLYKGRVKTHRGKVLDYLGVDLNYGSLTGVLLILMIKYLTKVLKEWPKELRGPKIN